MNATVLKDFWLPLVLALIAFISPFIATLIQNNARRREKQDDYVRQDAVAAQAAEAARLLSAAQAKTAARAEEVAALLGKNTATTNDKLDVIHHLVNSALTDAMASEHEAIQRSLVMMEEVVALKKAAGLTPTQETLGIIEATKIKIDELNSRLADRARQQSIVDKQMANKPDAKVGG